MLSPDIKKIFSLIRIIYVMSTNTNITMYPLRQRRFFHCFRLFGPTYAEVMFLIEFLNFLIKYTNFL
jgi:hypothetical protein